MPLTVLKLCLLCHCKRFVKVFFETSCSFYFAPHTCQCWTRAWPELVLGLGRLLRFSISIIIKIIITIAIIIFNININIESFSSSSTGGRLSIFFIFATHPFTFNRVCNQKSSDKFCTFGLTSYENLRNQDHSQPAQVGAASPGVFNPMLARDIALLWSHPAGECCHKKHEMRSSSARPGCRGGAPGRLRSVFPRLSGAPRRAWLPPHRWGHPQVWKTIGYIYLCFLYIYFITIFW